MENLAPDRNTQNGRSILYSKLQDLHSLNRHLVSERQRDNETYALLRSWQKIFPEENLDFTQGVLINLINQVQAEIQKLAKPEEVMELRSESCKRCLRFMRERREIRKRIDEASRILSNFMKEIFNKPVNQVTNQTFKTIEDCQKIIEGKRYF
jgi:hypothetical protein